MMIYFFERKASEFRWCVLERIAGSVVLAALQFHAAACSGTPPPTESIARAEIRLRTAMEARADEIAPMELRTAREKLADAKKAMSAGRHDDARRLAEAAEVEAELAEAKADAEIVRRAADGLRRSTDALRQEMERGIRGTVSPQERR